MVILFYVFMVVAALLVLFYWYPEIIKRWLERLVLWVEDWEAAQEERLQERLIVAEEKITRVEEAREALIWYQLQLVTLPLDQAQ